MNRPAPTMPPHMEIKAPEGCFAFVACPACARCPDDADLCDSCRANRQTIHDLRHKAIELRGQLRPIVETLIFVFAAAVILLLLSVLTWLQRP